MLFTNQWRIPILFVVSGIGTRFALAYRSGNDYVKERFSRLLIPLLFGALFIVAPQVYIERLTQGSTYDSFLHFYPDYFNGIYPQGNFSWHHLWFLPYLLLMSVVATPLFLNLRNENNAVISWLKPTIERVPWALYSIVIPLLIVELTLADKFPVTRALIDDWYAIPFFFILFIAGYTLVCCGDSFWNAVQRIRFGTLALGIICFPLLYVFSADSIGYSVVKIVNMWSWILTIFGFAATYLNKKSDLIRYRNQAVYPFYILHQTIIIICGYFLMENSMHYGLKMLILLIATFGGSWLIYEFVILRIPFIQPFLGVKRRR